MNKVKITSPEAMSDEQVREDIAMTPLERLHIAFQISDFALEIRPNPQVVEEESSPIVWVTLYKISS